MSQFKNNTLLTGKNKREFIPDTYSVSGKSDLLRGSSVVERGTHNPEVGGAQPSPASPIIIPHNIILGYN
jgi:hypothetical protein